MPLEVFTQRNFVADFIRLKLNFIPKTEKSVFEPPFGGLRGNICTPSIACRKGLLNFLFAIIAFFRYLLRLRRYKRKSVEVGVFRRGWVTFGANFRRKGASNTNHCWCRGISKYPHCIVWFCHKARLWQTDGRTDRRTVRITLPRPRLYRCVAR